jgi:hypothetical protein
MQTNSKSSRWRGCRTHRCGGVSPSRFKHVCGCRHLHLHSRPVSAIAPSNPTHSSSPSTQVAKTVEEIHRQNVALAQENMAMQVWTGCGQGLVESSRDGVGRVKRDL